MNKKLQTLLCLCAAAVVFGSCQKDEEKTVTTLSISIADSYTPNETNAKVVLDGITPKFEEGDQIWISGYPYTVNSDGTTVTGSGAETPYYAVFPYDEDMGEISGAFPTITLPTEQPYVSLENDEHGNPIQKINAPMWAYAAAGGVGGLSFHNACALLRVRVRNNMGMGVFTLKSITVTSSTNDIAGTGTLAYNEETGEYDLTVSGSKTVTLTGLNEAVKENKSSQEYYIYIPSVADETFTIIASGTYEEKVTMFYSFNRMSSNAINIDASRIGEVSLLLNGCDISEMHNLHTFSVSSSQKVYFSPGNLQYQTSSGTFRFAANQWCALLDSTKYGNKLTESQITGTESAKWIDLFGWGTSGYNHGNTYYHPYNRMYTNSNAVAYGYGPRDEETGTYPLSLTGEYANADWGVYNTIQNGDKINPAGMWRTLTKDEWNYILNERTNSNNLRTAAQVNGKKGYMLLPDEWIEPDGISLTITKTPTDNTLSVDQWRKLEAHGAVFLPYTGYRNGTTSNSATPASNYFTSSCYYWTSSAYSNLYAYCVQFTGSGNIQVIYSSLYRYYGYAVRLVCDVK